MGLFERRISTCTLFFARMHSTATSSPLSVQYGRVCTVVITRHFFATTCCSVTPSANESYLCPLSLVLGFGPPSPPQTRISSTSPSWRSPRSSSLPCSRSTTTRSWSTTSSAAAWFPCSTSSSTPSCESCGSLAVSCFRFSVSSVRLLRLFLGAGWVRRLVLCRFCGSTSCGLCLLDRVRGWCDQATSCPAAVTA